MEKNNQKCKYIKNMEIKKKKIDIIKHIDKKSNIIMKNIKLIDNLFLNKLYRNYLLSHKKKKNHQNIFEILSEKPEKKKLVEKIIISGVIKKIPPYLLQYYSEYEFKNFANKLISSSSKKNKKQNNSYSIHKNKTKIYSRNKSCSYRTNNNNLTNKNNTYNDENKINIFKIKNIKKISSKKSNQKKIILSSKPSKPRKYSSNILRTNYITLIENTNTNTNKDPYENNKLFQNNNLYMNNNKLYFAVSSKNNNFKTSIFNTNNSINNLTDDDATTNTKQKSSNNLANTHNNNENIKSNNIYNYNYSKKKNRPNKLLLNVSNSNEKSEKKYNSRLLLENNISYVKNNLFNLPKKKIKTDLLISSLSPEEILITDKASNIINNLNEIKKEIKTERNETPRNIKHMILKIKKNKNNDALYLKNEVEKTKSYEYYIKNKKQLERKKNVFKVLRNSFNTERTKRNANENTFIKTLYHICDEEKHFDQVEKQVYKQNYWLRLNRNKKNAEDIKNRIIKINDNQNLLNHLISEINKLNNKCNNND